MTDQAQVAEESVAAMARRLGVSWHTANRRHGAAQQAEIPPYSVVAPAGDPEAFAKAAYAAMERLLRGHPPNDIVIGGPPARPAATENLGGLVHAPKPYERVVFLSDCHHPYQDQRSIDAAMACIEDWKPDLFVIAGDHYDCSSISDYERDPDKRETLQDEFDAAQANNKRIDDLGCDVVFLKGNHENRIERMIIRNPGLYKLRSLELSIAADLPKRWQVYPSQTHYKIGPPGASLVLFHGDIKGRGNAMKHAAAGMLDKMRTTCMGGDKHRFGFHPETGYDGTVRAGFANGHMSDVLKANYIRVPSWQMGYSQIDFDYLNVLFDVHQHLIVDGKFRYNGKTYGV